MTVMATEKPSNITDPNTGHVTLTKTRTFTTTVEINEIETHTSDASWTTPDGYVVHRTTRFLTYGGHPVSTYMADSEGVQYKVGNKRGYFSTHDTLRDARTRIAHLRRTGR